MPTIAQAVEANQKRIAAGGATGTGVGQNPPPQDPSAPLVQPVSPMPMDMPLGGGFPQRGTYPASIVLASDLSDSNREYRSMSTRSATFPYQPQVNQISKTTVKEVASSSAAKSILLEVNGFATPSQTVANFIASTGMVITTDPFGGIYFQSTASGDGLNHGTLPWETDPSSLLIAEDFLSVGTATLNSTGVQGPYGLYGWNFVSVTPVSVITNVQAGALYGSTGAGLGGSIAWDNNGTAGNAGALVMNQLQSSSSNAYANPGGFALLENPGWKSTFIWSVQQSTSNSSNFSIAKKCLYVGFASPNYTAATNNSSNSPTYNGRPANFFGIRYDTSVGQSIAISSVTSSSPVAGYVKYTFTGNNTYGLNGGLVGQMLVFSGFATSAYNGTFLCVGSTNAAVIVQSSATGSTASGTMTTLGLNDTFYTFENTQNPVYSGSQVRNNTVGLQSVTSIKPAIGVWHRLDITCTSAGQLVMTLDGSTTWTTTVSQLSYVIEYSGSNASALNAQANGGFANLSAAQTPAGGITAVQPTASVYPCCAGSVITFAGLGASLSALNGTWTATYVSAGCTNISFYAPGAGTVSNANPSNGATVSGYPALLPYFAAGNDDTASPTNISWRFCADFFGLAVNPELGTGSSTASSSKARYF